MTWGASDELDLAHPNPPPPSRSPTWHHQVRPPNRALRKASHKNPVTMPRETDGRVRRQPITVREVRRAADDRVPLEEDCTLECDSTD